MKRKSQKSKPKNHPNTEKSKPSRNKLCATSLFYNPEERKIPVYNETIVSL